jgi:pimeloyl-ACP methyl ester carboxylesterase
LVHGFSQNRHAWTSGEFVKNLLFFGLDIHILELRGHGRSSVEFQRERSKKFDRPPPADLDWDWDIDSYFLYDLPAAVAGVKRITRRRRIFYCGHSMGGMLGYGYAGIHDDFDGLITIGAASDLGRGLLFLRAMALSVPLLGYGVDMAYGSLNLRRKATQVAPASASPIATLVQALRRESEAHGLVPQGDGDAEAADLRFRYIPMDSWLKRLERALVKTQTMNPVLGKLGARMARLANLERMGGEDIRWLLREGGEREPRKVIEQFAKWIRRGELRCYRTGYDFKRGFSKIRVPMAIIFGDMDPLASVESTRSVYRAAQSEYLLWRPVKGNSHVELTMGHDIRQICYDIKNLIEYARTHRNQAPVLPRVR